MSTHYTKNKNKKRFCVPYIHVERHCQYRNHCQMWQPTSYSYGSKIRIPVWGHIISGHFNNPVFWFNQLWIMPSIPIPNSNQEAVPRSRYQERNTSCYLWISVRKNPSKPSNQKINQTHPNPHPRSRSQQKTTVAVAFRRWVQTYKQTQWFSWSSRISTTSPSHSGCGGSTLNHYLEVSPNMTQIWGSQIGVPTFHTLAIHSWMCRSCHPAVYWV